MKKMLLALALMASVGFAQEGVKVGNFTYLYDVDSATATYCSMTGVGGDPYGGFIPGPGTIETSGSSTTVTGVVAADDVFEALAVGDTILVNGVYRYLTAKASSDSVTVDTAINLDIDGGYVWSWKDQNCGTGATDGWVTVAGYDTILMGVHFVQGDIDTLDMFWECKTAALGAQPQRVYPGESSDCGDGTLSGTVCQMSTAGQSLTYRLEDNMGTFEECRIGLAYGSTDTSDAGSNIEQVTATVSVGR